MVEALDFEIAEEDNVAFGYGGESFEVRAEDLCGERGADHGGIGEV